MRPLLTALTLSIILMGTANARTAKKAPTVPLFSAKSFLIADSDGTIIKEQDIYEALPIASISKLMVAMLASDQNLKEYLEIPSLRTVSTSIPKRVKSLTREQILTLALVKSDNLAAQVLCNNIIGCIDRMNGKATEIGMSNTHYAEPTGLSAENISTANDLLKLILVASDNKTITELSSKPYAEIPTNGKPIKIRNTNPLTRKFDIILSKTGFTKEAGGCLVMVMHSSVGQRILILLGSKNAKTRIPDMERLVNGIVAN